MDWSTHYPKFYNEDGKSKDGQKVEWADVGCGFGGLLMSLAPQFPDTLMLGTSLSLSGSPSRADNKEWRSEQQ